jgi:hypothetical protein
MADFSLRVLKNFWSSSKYFHASNLSGNGIKWHVKRLGSCTPVYSYIYKIFNCREGGVLFSELQILKKNI